MTFTTLTFIVFLVVVFATYWSLRENRHRNLLLVVVSYVFYGWWDARFCTLMLGSSLLDYFVAQRVQANEGNERLRFRWLWVACSGNLTLLGIFKYYNFFAANAVALATSLGVHLSYTTLNIVLPVGISFYTFQTMSYTIDVYRRRLPASRDLVEFLAYVAFFPQLVAGPIERAHHLLPQFQTPRRFDAEKAREGVRFMVWGFFKKMALADNLGVVADAVYGKIGSATGPEIILGTFCFGFQIYCDFSAYSDIAVGTAKLFGFDLMRNFAYPYFSRSVAEFWRRWHISLSGWFSDYVYVSLGGSRVSRARRAVNVLVTFLLSGLWHGASWNYVAWGALNGAAVLPATLWPPEQKVRATDVPGGTSRLPSPLTVLRILATFVFITFTWVYFRAATLAEAHAALGRVILGPWNAPAFGVIQAQSTLLLAVVGLIVMEWINRRHWHPLMVQRWPRPVRWTLYTAMIWITLGTAPPAAGTRFIYFQF